jgi:signal transduction histidine kinase
VREVSEARTADRHPGGDLAALPELVEGFGWLVVPQAVLRRDPSVPDGLPHEVQAAAYRIVQEALTKVRRHAADATEVTVGLTYDGRVDDGRGGTRLRPCVVFTARAVAHLAGGVRPRVPRRS